MGDLISYQITSPIILLRAAKRLDMDRLKVFNHHRLPISQSTPFRLHNHLIKTNFNYFFDGKTVKIRIIFLHLYEHDFKNLNGHRH